MRDYCNRTFFKIANKVLIFSMALVLISCSSTKTGQDWSYLYYGDKCMSSIREAQNKHQFKFFQTKMNILAEKLSKNREFPEYIVRTEQKKVFSNNSIEYYFSWNENNKSMNKSVDITVQKGKSEKKDLIKQFKSKLEGSNVDLKKTLEIVNEIADLMIFMNLYSIYTEYDEVNQEQVNKICFNTTFWYGYYYEVNYDVKTEYLIKQKISDKWYWYAQFLKGF